MLNHRLILQDIDFVLATLEHVFRTYKISVLQSEVESLQKKLKDTTCTHTRLLFLLEMYDKAKKVLGKEDVYLELARRAIAKHEIEDTINNLRCCKSILPYIEEDESIHNEETQF